ncbi:hypothetical protein SBV1_3630004 [Verrucomicrobia bacterium]|nr:hypothetical protein SBV1_3630004 [Verrucomicrobiota bacterium]
MARAVFIPQLTEPRRAEAQRLRQLLSEGPGDVPPDLAAVRARMVQLDSEIKLLESQPALEDFRAASRRIAELRIEHQLCAKREQQLSSLMEGKQHDAEQQREFARTAAVQFLTSLGLEYYEAHRANFQRLVEQYAWREHLAIRAIAVIPWFAGYFQRAQGFALNWPTKLSVLQVSGLLDLILAGRDFVDL